MKSMKAKVLAASLALAFSAGAQAAMTQTTASTGSSLFLTAWVATVGGPGGFTGVTYARNLGITMGDLLNNVAPNSATAPNAAWVSESGALFDKTSYTNFGSDANWTNSGLNAFFGSADVKWNITAAEAGTVPVSYLSTFDTTGTVAGANGSNINARASSVGNFILALTTPGNFAAGPTPDCAANNSCYSSWNTGNNATADGSPFGANWAGSDTAAEGTEGISFWYHRATNTSLSGSFAPIQFKNSLNTGKWFLEADGDVRYELDAAAAPIPVPGALWLLGSGLLGFFAVARRRKLGQPA